MPRPSLSSAATAAAVTATVVAAAVAVRSYSSPRLPPVAAQSAPRVITDWLVYAQGDTLHLGRPNSVVVTVFSDYLCRYCAIGDQILQAVARGRAKDLTIIVRHAPQSPLARDASLAAVCAAEQGAFARVHAALFTHSDSLRVRQWHRFAAGLGLERPEDFVECIESERASVRLLNDRSQASEIGIGVTPSMLLDSLLFVGTPNRRFVERYLSVVRARRTMDRKPDTGSSSAPRGRW